MKIGIHPLSENPTAAWQKISQEQNVIKTKIETLSTPVTNDKLRFVCMSDTHSQTHRIKFDIPNGDVFIHAGDFSKHGNLQEVLKFNDWLGTLPHKHKIVIAGNHDVSFDPAFIQKQSLSKNEDFEFYSNQAKNIKEKLQNCTYLEDSHIIIDGIKIYGSPWTPKFYNWAFNLPRGQACLSKWDMIPSDTDIVVTHGPAIGYGDLCHSGCRAGCVELLSTIQNRIHPKYHVFGHIHEGYGMYSDGNVMFVNASTCNLNISPVNQPIVFDVNLPPGVEKS